MVESAVTSTQNTRTISTQETALQQTGEGRIQTSSSTLTPPNTTQQVQHVSEESSNIVTEEEASAVPTTAEKLLDQNMASEISVVDSETLNDTNMCESTEHITQVQGQRAVSSVPQVILTPTSPNSNIQNTTTLPTENILLELPKISQQPEITQTEEERRRMIRAEKQIVEEEEREDLDLLLLVLRLCLLVRGLAVEWIGACE